MPRGRRITTLLLPLLLNTALVLAGAAVAGCGASSAESPAEVPNPLRVGLVPNVAPDEQRARYEPFRAYLADRLAVDVELVVATDYAGVVVALVNGQVDLAYVGGLTYAQARTQAPVEPLVTEVDEATGTEFYHAAVVVPADSPHQSTADVVEAGGTFAFGDVSSTSGSLYPRQMVIDAGAQCQPRDLSACPPLRSVVFTGGHDAAAQAVLQGSADAAGVELRILRRLEAEGAVPAGALRPVETREVIGYPWVARAGLSEPARAELVHVFTGIDDPELLSLLRAVRYTPVTAADYQELEQAAQQLGLLTAG
ncbi:phosphate/phosphite/phosphonate ABC transporter substrate-binding protein [Natronosporangium hydrolyticum]|uniref:Phosphate/phosphite/phosphonate ABC transporter substrate-binding protein n=1 Tax=Natronosporangium hydrolyticum TaxID=2811111 RepID=A0A895YJU2_9ACTN|nr:phosphate/phosphite/phosphonate ABC transporter substrate-binding protein [Natronosporangium hydrolyticum]QSB16302.1 phosphate/phosphite/phosphonate ABC transporter substrate-binding protein [Natronosporangium hydrolyticum]